MPLPRQERQPQGPDRAATPASEVAAAVAVVGAAAYALAFGFSAVMALALLVCIVAKVR